MLIKFTWVSDLDLDGLVTPNDSAIFGGNYDYNNAAYRAIGDMNLDGLYTEDDVTIFNGNYDEYLYQL